ncbi:MAG: class I SAM-dependent methyltransferase [Planctomycetota bacterium]|jgi:ubiquinone/menaquinone biosynthesis C-methylase UbiE
MESQRRDFVYLPSPKRKPVYDLILKFLGKRLPPSALVLDLGCATGDFVKAAREYGFNARGCDYSQAAVNHGREKYSLPLIQGQIENIPSDNDSFDAVTLLQVFEHLPEPLEALKEIRRVLRPSGLIFIETPNYLPYYYVERYLKILVPLYCKISGRFDLPWFPFEHLYHWTSETIMAILAKAGFRRCQTHFIDNFRSEIPLDHRLSLPFRFYASIGKGIYGLTKSVALDFRPGLLATAVKSDSTIVEKKLSTQATSQRSSEHTAL